jgi:hypothetical protein
MLELESKRICLRRGHALPQARAVIRLNLEDYRHLHTHTHTHTGMHTSLVTEILVTYGRRSEAYL